MSGADETGERLRHLDAILASRRDMGWVDRAVVLEECGSTQDEALAAATGRPGLLLTALRQVKGRGRLGRTWSQKAGLGLAVTFVLDGEAHDPGSLPLRVACAICDACERVSALQTVDVSDAVPHFRIKWPNDVVVALEVHDRYARARKLAGVLIERREGLLLVGIGINIQQREEDFPASLRGKAVSLAMLGEEVGDVPRHDWVLRRLIESLDRFLSADRREVRQQFRARDVLSGTRRVFEHDRRRFEGAVESIDPIDGIALRLDDGTSITLPAMTTTLVPESE